MGATTRIVHGLTRSRRQCAGAVGLCNLAPTSRRPFVPQSQPRGAARIADHFSTSRPEGVLGQRRLCDNLLRPRRNLAGAMAPTKPGRGSQLLATARFRSIFTNPIDPRSLAGRQG